MFFGMKPARNRSTAVILAKLGCVTVLFVVLSLRLYRHSEPSPRIQIPPFTPHVDWKIPENLTQHRAKEKEKWPTIPNIVHYVHLMKNVQGDMNLKFEDFLSVYSSLHYFDAETIFIHTDASPESLKRARDPNNEKSKWTRKIFDLPRVVVRYGTAPKYADNGVKIKNLPNRSDFLRAKVVYEQGGIYLDFDVFPLRDFKPFREAGFANVVGLEKYEKVNSGCYMSIKGSELMRVWLKYEHIVYDGGWITHAVELLTNIVRRINRIPYEVLILQKDTWAPGSWELGDASELYSSHPSASPSDASEYDFDQERALNSGDLESVFESDLHLESWQKDWSVTYAIHAFKGEPEKIDNFDGYSVAYILSRRSNMARALYPAVTHAVEEGYLSIDD
jgi:hypothetical protein